jgi:hypothetical protein
VTVGVRIYNSKHGDAPSAAVYVGRRAKGMHFGNPFTHLATSLATVRVPTRAMAIQAFADWLKGTAHQEIDPDRRQWILDNLRTLKGKDLVCYCVPLSCHAEVLARLAEET